MKKILVLMLVLGMASLASAGLTVTQTAGTLTIENDTVYTLSPTGQFEAQLVINEPGSLDGTYSFGPAASAITTATVPYLMNSYAASSFGLGGSELIDWSYMLVVDDPVTLNLLGVGDVLSYGLTGGAVSGTLYDGSGGVITTFIPEPMTLALLGLGGLFLRRRK